MAMTRIIVQVPTSLKAKLDAQRKSGTSASWLIRHLLEQHFKQERRKPAV
ncbi:MAG TPA: hypothetical protein VF443_03275 [Nitrospira sp.]